MSYLGAELIETTNEINWNIDLLIEVFSQEFRHLRWNKVLEGFDVI